MMLTRDNVFRNTKNYYLTLEPEKAYSGRLVSWCAKRAGKRILDYGCAIGVYCTELAKKGFVCTGVDVNEEYVRRARERGVDAAVVHDRLPFEDKSFDTVIMLELLEHVEDPDKLLSEAVRVARRNVLITVPNSTEFQELKKQNLTYEHMLDTDHVRFFTQDALQELLSGYFRRCVVTKEEPIYPHSFLPWYFRKPVSLMIGLGAVRPLGYFRLYAECFV